MDWFVIFIIGFVAGYIFDNIWAMIVNKREGKFILKKLRIHHSCIGGLCIIVSIYIFFFALISFGLGMIIGHTIRHKKLVFIEKI